MKIVKELSLWTGICICQDEKLSLRSRDVSERLSLRLRDARESLSLRLRDASERLRDASERLRLRLRDVNQRQSHGDLAVPQVVGDRQRMLF
jgi:hypothetical protein